MPAEKQRSIRRPALFVTAASLLAAGVISQLPLQAEIRGGAGSSHGTILTWGTDLTEWSDGKPKVLRRGQSFGEGGCVAPGGVIVQQKPGLSAMLRVPLDGGPPEVIEPETEFSDCLWTTLFGRPGVLVVHRYSQVRFYEPKPSKWAYQEVYSIYTASRQGGLVETEVDGDGLPDFFVGNYWMKSPAAFDLPWRIFAINLYHETEMAALARLAPFRGRDLIWAERTGRRVTWFERPPNVREQWIAHPLDVNLDHVNGLAVDGESVYLGDNRRVVVWREGEVTELATGFTTLRLIFTGGKLWAITPSGVRRIPQRRK